MHAKSVEMLSLPVSVVWKFSGGVRVWLTSSSLGHGSKLRGPSPTALVLLHISTCRPSSIVVRDTDCGAVGPGFVKGMEVCKKKSAFVAWRYSK
ncbi:hypothetical protein TNCV_4477731 [Trichonephila clavipes]|nr:hypothetical protein TNCV_4477731 [Trichonephila clavipes]